jgi:glycosyltransferase involved in cell wall biosynthesis
VRIEGGIAHAWLEHPTTDPARDFAGATSDYCQWLTDLVGSGGGDRIVWMSTPAALDIAAALDAAVLVYDVTDDRASVGSASTGADLFGHVAAHAEALAAADVVLTDGPALHRRVIQEGRPDARLIPSGVDPEHFAMVRRGRPPSQRPVAGYVGPIDERIDRGLVAALAELMAGWDIVLAGPGGDDRGPVAPPAGNVTYLGPPTYAELPEVLARIDVAIVPVAPATPSAASATTTLECLAAGLPVVATPVPDIVTQFGTLVDIQDHPSDFAAACDRALRPGTRRYKQRVATLLRRRHWDAVTAEIEGAVLDAGNRRNMGDLLA